MQHAIAKYLQEHKVPAKREFKDSVFHIEPLAQYVMESLSFEDALDLIRSKKEFIENPVEDGKLHMIWDLLLDTHWKEFIFTNSLYLLKRQYKWTDAIVTVFYAKLRSLWLTFVDTTDQPRFPLFYLPELTPLGEEEYISVYSLTAFYYGNRTFYIGLGDKSIQILTEEPWMNDENEWRFTMQTENPRDETMALIRNIPITLKADRIEFARQMYTYLRVSSYVDIAYPEELKTQTLDVIKLMRLITAERTMTGIVSGIDGILARPDVSIPLIAITILLNLSLDGLARLIPRDQLHVPLFKYSDNARQIHELTKKHSHYVTFTHKIEVDKRGLYLHVVIRDKRVKQT